MKRRLVKQGDNALTVTLPSSWTRENNLKPKDEVDIEELDGDLLIRTNARQIVKRVNLELGSSNQKYIDAIFRNLYINGYDEIRVRFESEEDLFLIANSIDALVGYEIETQKEKQCVVRNITTTEQEDYESVFKKVFYITFMMEEIVESRLSGKSSEIDKDKMRKFSKDASKFSCFARRIIFKSNLSKNEEGISKYTIINLIHMIARNYQSIFDSIPAKPDDSLRKYNKEVNSFLRKSFSAYCNKDAKAVEQILGDRSKLIKKGASIKGKPKELECTHYMMEIARICGTIAGKVGFLITLQNKF